MDADVRRRNSHNMSKINTGIGLLTQDLPDAKTRSCKVCKTIYTGRNEDYCFECWWERRGTKPETKVPSANIYKLKYDGDLS